MLTPGRPLSHSPGHLRCPFAGLQGPRSAADRADPRMSVTVAAVRHDERQANTSARIAAKPPLRAGANTRLRELALLFLRLGTTSFGGPAAHIALMEYEVVTRRRWMTRGQFLDYVGATNLIPGPNSTELAIHIGHARAGRAGLLVAGASFIVPATLIITAVAWAYTRYGKLPDAAALLYGVKPVVIGVVAVALWRLGRSAVKTAPLALLGLLAVVMLMLGVHELAVLGGAGAVMAGARLLRGSPRRTASALLLGALAASNVGAAAASAPAAPFGLFQLFLVFAKTGAVLFGSGYVLLAFLRADLVERLGWMTEHQLLEAIAIGQMMPGPVFATATFIGYILGGPAGAVLATIGIFFPAFVFVAISGPLVPRLRHSPVAGAVLDGVNVASLALMAVVAWYLGRAALVDVWTTALAVAVVFALTRYRVNSALLVVAGGLLGWFFR